MKSFDRRTETEPFCPRSEAEAGARISSRSTGARGHTFRGWPEHVHTAIRPGGLKPLLRAPTRGKYLEVPAEDRRPEGTRLSGGAGGALLRRCQPTSAYSSVRLRRGSPSADGASCSRPVGSSPSDAGATLAHGRLIRGAPRRLDRLDRDLGHLPCETTFDLCRGRAMPIVSTPRSLDLAHLRTALWFHQQQATRFVSLTLRRTPLLGSLASRSRRLGIGARARPWPPRAPHGPCPSRSRGPPYRRRATMAAAPRAEIGGSANLKDPCRCRQIAKLRGRDPRPSIQGAGRDEGSVVAEITTWPPYCRPQARARFSVGPDTYSRTDRRRLDLGLAGVHGHVNEDGAGVFHGSVARRVRAAPPRSRRRRSEDVPAIAVNRVTHHGVMRASASHPRRPAHRKIETAPVSDRLRGPPRVPFAKLDCGTSKRRSASLPRVHRARCPRARRPRSPASSSWSARLMARRS